MKTLQTTIRAVLSLSVSALLFVPGCLAPQPGDDGEDVTEDIEGEGADEENIGEAESELVAWCDPTVSWSSAWASFEDEVIDLMNEKRAAGATCKGVVKPPLPPVVKDKRLRCAARRHSKDMSTNNFHSHTGSDGSTHVQRISKSGYPGSPGGENIAGGQTTPAKVMASWMASAHCNGIMNGQHTRVGVGYSHKATASYKHYWTVDFGRP